MPRVSLLHCVIVVTACTTAENIIFVAYSHEKSDFSCFFTGTIANVYDVWVIILSCSTF